MLKEFKTSTMIELKKISKQLYDAFDSALNYRKSLIEQVGTSEFEYQKYNSLSDPESYYHFRLFDNAVSIVRLYDKNQWLVKDRENDFHFSVKCYGFNPKFNIKNFSYGSNNFYYGDYESIEKAIPTFVTACMKLADTKYAVSDNNLFSEVLVTI